MPVDFFDAKADLESLLKLTGPKFEFSASEHPALQKGQTAKIVSNDKQVGWVRNNAC
jgi:phenylalanyl-tRNA synthetase beta chain